MPMRTTPYNMTIADYAEQLRNKQVIVNHNYQRSDKVWPIAAKSNLIDTILNGYPVPKLIFSQKTDLDTRKTRKEVVDGQQRTAAIIEFLDNKYILSRGDFVGNRFSTLPEAKQREFVDYMLSADTFTSATDEEIREVFRRINSYQVPLNKQETRHATHQGEFKWFIRDLGKQYATSFIKIGIMGEKQISRMNDLELLTELVDLTINGIRTSSPSHLDEIYTSRDKSFPEREMAQETIEYGIGSIIDMPEIHQTKLMSKGNLYSLFGAIVAVRFPNSTLRSLMPSDTWNSHAGDNEISSNLTTLSSALDGDENGFDEFVLASKQGTNTLKNRKTRFEHFVKALTSNQI